MIQWNKEQPLLFFAVDPCKRIDTNEHRETLIYNWICCGSLEVINTQRKKSVQICNCGILSRTQTQKFVESGRLSTQRKTNCRGSRKVVNTTQKQSGLGFESTQMKVEFLLKGTQHKKWLHTKMIAEVNQHNLNWMDTEKWSSCKKFQC